jgi:hypothetical protein
MQARNHLRARGEWFLKKLISSYFDSKYSATRCVYPIYIHINRESLIWRKYKNVLIVYWNIISIGGICKMKIQIAARTWAIFETSPHTRITTINNSQVLKWCCVLCAVLFAGAYLKAKKIQIQSTFHIFHFMS